MVREIEVIFHLAAAVGVRLVADDPVRTIETNIYPTEVLLRLVLRHPTRTLTADQANRIRDRIYAAVHKGAVSQWAARG